MAQLPDVASALLDYGSALAILRRARFLKHQEAVLPGVVIQIKLVEQEVPTAQFVRDPEMDNPGRWYDYGTEVEHRERIEHLRRFRDNERRRRAAASESGA